MSVQKLEKQFEASELARRKVEEKKEFKKLGLPSPVVQKLASTLAKIEEAKQGFSKTLTPEAFKTVAEIFDTVHSQIKAIAESKEFKMEINGLTDRAEAVNANLQTVLDTLETSVNLLTSLDQKLTAEFNERDKIRQKQLAVIAKLDKYLDDWV